MKTVEKFRRRIIKLEGRLDCQKCPIPKKDCESISMLLWGETKCLLRYVLSEILIFCADARDKSSVYITNATLKRRKP